MKDFVTYIFEYDNPDHIDIKVNKEGGKVHFNAWNNGAFAFMYDVEKDETIFGNAEETPTHYDLYKHLKKNDEETYKRLCLDKTYGDVRWGDNYDGYAKSKSKRAKEDYADYKANSPWVEKVKMGRIWNIATAIHDSYYYDADEIEPKYKYRFFIAFWDELTEAEYNKIVKSIMRDAWESFDIVSDEDIENKKKFKVYAVDNNGHPKLFKDGKTTKIDARSEDSKDIIKDMRAIHLASQAEKRKFFDAFRKNRDERNQKEKYNHTKSKTEAEWRAIRYQGDSLVDYVQNKINEKANFIVKKHIKGDDNNSPQYVLAKFIFDTLELEPKDMHDDVWEHSQNVATFLNVPDNPVYNTHWEVAFDELPQSDYELLKDIIREDDDEVRKIRYKHNKKGIGTYISLNMVDGSIVSVDMTFDVEEEFKKFAN